jgi:hypothetical protein
MKLVPVITASTAAVSSINASMNADGDIFKQLKTTTITATKETTSSDSLKNIAIAGISAGFASGFSQAMGIQSAANAANAATSVGTTQTANQIIQNLKISLAQSAISNATSTAVQSAINGDSFKDSLGNMAINIAVGAIANSAAKEIGNAAHPVDSNGNALPAKIDQATQLTLHAALGCASGAATGSNCAAGAAAGVVGELTGNALKDQVADGSLNRQTAIQVAGLAGSAASLVTSSLIGQSDEEIANSIFVGQRIGSNAAENNALQVMAQKVAGTQNHLTIVHTPEPDEQALYANKDGYVQDKESGLWIRTWGAGTDNWKENILNGERFDLTSNNNRERDVNLLIKNYASPNLVPQSQEGHYAQILNDLDLNYQDNLKYDLFPALNSSSGYNSNSYVAGLLIAADISPPSIPDKKINYQWQSWEYENSNPISVEYKLPFQVPGYEKPVPLQYFKSN